MNLDQISLFIAVYESGSFAKAAQRLNIDPSKVSRSISALEHSLNTRLFNRTTRKLTPTSAGAEYFKRVQAPIEEISQIHQELIETDNTVSGTLRLSASVSFGQIVIAPLIRAFRQQYPDITLELILSDSWVDLVDDRIDVAIRHGNMPDSSLIARKLLDPEYVLVASKQYLDTHGYLDSPAELSDHQILTFTYQGFNREWRFTNQNDSVTHQIQPSVSTSNAVTLLECAKQGLGVALLADWTVAESIKSGELVRLAPDWRFDGNRGDSGIWLVQPSNRYVPAKTKAFSDFLLTHVGTNSTLLVE